MEMKNFDIIVVGGGHAGIEAAHAASRLGLATALVTHAAAEVGRMPCNPAIGGLGKGHLVREIDALGGVMGRVIDRTGIQFRVLNRRKGPAVQAPRAQADKHSYQAAMVELVGTLPGLTVVEADAEHLLTEADGDRRRVLGVGLAGGRELRAPRVILCSGTFLGGLMHVGEDRTPGGREGAAASTGLSGSLRDAGFELLRLKTGTPPRLHAGSLDYDRLEVQPGDPEPRPFSHFTAAFDPDQVECWLTATGAEAHRLIRANLQRSPLYAGAIAGTGPRYCPSIEDKVVRFPERASHTVFLEPEGLDTPEIYVNGISTSLPRDVQEAVVRSIPGLEEARFLRYGYAVEYDSVPSWQITPSLESQPVAGLWLAGQILGTSGYEEAAAQGLLAGLNAARSLLDRAPLVLRRDEAYLGVLVDDLNTKEISEPYRMFTSRAEHRLSLRCDNAATRLLPRAEEAGLLAAAELEALRERAAAVRGLVSGLDALPSRNPRTGDAEPAAATLRRPEADLEAVAASSAAVRESVAAALTPLPPAQRPEAISEVETTVKYAGYVARQRRREKEQAHLDALEIPPDFEYARHAQLSAEAREKLGRLRPATLGQASRIDGVRAADLSVLSVLLRRESA